MTLRRVLPFVGVVVFAIAGGAVAAPEKPEAQKPQADAAARARIACAAPADRRVDLAATSSKYIGETEKNLRAALAAGEALAVALTFDEADALFGKRTEVKDSHDRFANIEVSYFAEQRGEKLKGFSRRAFLGGFDRRAPKQGVIVMERTNGVDMLRFNGAARARAIALARAYDRACG